MWCKYCSGELNDTGVCIACKKDNRLKGQSDLSVFDVINAPKVVPDANPADVIGMITNTAPMAEAQKKQEGFDVKKILALAAAFVSGIAVGMLIMMLIAMNTLSNIDRQLAEYPVPVFAPVQTEKKENKSAHTDENTACMIIAEAANATETEATPVEATPVEATPVEATQVEATKAEATQVEATQTEATQVEATQTEATQTEATQTEATQTEATPVETTSVEASAAEPVESAVAADEANAAESSEEEKATADTTGNEANETEATADEATKEEATICEATPTEALL